MALPAMAQESTADAALVATSTERSSGGIAGLSRGRLEAREQRRWELKLPASMAAAAARAQSEEGARKGTERSTWLRRMDSR